MFTGLIEEVGRVVSVEPVHDRAKIVVEAPTVSSDARPGDSICINGVCLTVVERSGDRLAFDAVPETLSRSSLGTLTPGSGVNLERSLAVGARMGGHFVQGHVDATASIVAINVLADSYEIAFEIDAPDADLLLVEKGGVALDGISLTLASVEAGRFMVAIIPFTWTHTNLSERSPGDLVNVEFDILGKYVVNALTQRIGAR